MFKRLSTLLVLLSAMVLTTGCAVNRATATLSPGTDLSQAKTIYVVKQPKDKNAVDALIAADLTKRGYAVTTGPELASAPQADMTVTYVDKWMWDITMYMIELSVTMRDAKTGYPLAVGNSYHTSLTRKSPPAMVDEVMNNIFTAPKR